MLFSWVSCIESVLVQLSFTGRWRKFEMLFLLQTNTHTHTHTHTHTQQASRLEVSDTYKIAEINAQKCTADVASFFQLDYRCWFTFHGWEISLWHQNVENTHTCYNTLKLLVKLNHLVWAQFYRIKIFFLEKKIVLKIFCLAYLCKIYTFVLIHLLYLNMWVNFIDHI